MPAQETSSSHVSLDTTRGYKNSQDEWPLGKLWNPSFSLALSGCRQAVEEINKFHSGSWPPSPPKAYCCTVAGSKLHRDSRSGLGFPYRFFIPSVKRKVVARPKAKPIHAVFNSHSFILHTTELGEPRVMPGAGLKIRATKAMMTAGMTKAMTARRPEEIFSCSTNGKDMLGSTGENGLWFGVTFQKPPPTAAMPL